MRNLKLNVIAAILVTLAVGTTLQGCDDDQNSPTDSEFINSTPTKRSRAKVRSMVDSGELKPNTKYDTPTNWVELEVCKQARADYPEKAFAVVSETCLEQVSSQTVQPTPTTPAR